MAKLITKTETKSSVKAGSKTVPTPKDIRKELKGIVEHIETQWVEFSLLASEVYESEVWKAWGFGTLEDYAVSELGMEYRTFMYRVHTGNVIRQLGLGKDEISKVGASKFKEIAHLLNENTSSKDVQRYLEKAEKLSFRELATFVKNERLVQEGRGEADKRVTMKFRFLNEQADVVSEALTVAKNTIEVASDDVALEYICLEFLQISKHNLGLKEEVHIKEEKKVSQKKKANAGKPQNKKNQESKSK